MVPAFPNLTFDRPVDLKYAPGDLGRLFVVEQKGRILAFANDEQASSTEVFLDIAPKVRSYKGHHNEEGLLALEFHPRYAESGLFFVDYTASRPMRSVVSRFSVSTSDANRADPASETVLLEVTKPYGNHNGCCLLFGPDGYLYISYGDGGWAGDPHGNGQNLNSLLGKILRIDVDREESGRRYAIPPDNPFVDRPNARGEVWAYGLRNVWRMSFDRETGDLWAGDVGQDKWEEIDLIVKGGNYGWNIREGKHPFKRGESPDPLIDPVTEYDHYAGLSVTGGYVYRGPSLPRLRGAYVYADYATGRIWGLRYRDGQVLEERVILEQPKNVASFGEGPDGELFLLCFDGKIYKLQER